ncbi:MULTISPECIES: hypothetical protein [unclassified Clostridium]|nr:MULTISPECIES: hypothetical protein [unclassified Clostridium]
MCTIKCPLFINKEHYLQNKITDKADRKIHLLSFCCGKYTECEFYRNE